VSKTDRHLYLVKPATEAEKVTHTVTDVIEITPNSVKAWKAPKFQRPKRVNSRVKQLVEEIKKSGVLPGVITLGQLHHDTYLVDGQHRLEAFLLSELPVGYCEVRVVHGKSMAELAKEYDNLNAVLVTRRPDDRLKAQEEWSTVLQQIRKACPFVGYDMVRRNPHSPIVSMSNLLRMWNGSSKEVPSSGGASAVDIAETLSSEESRMLIEFTQIAHDGWGRDPEFARLWGSLNMQICMWLFRRTVYGYNMPSTSRVVRLDKPLFKKCLTGLSANSAYLDWLVGRQITDRDRSPCYARVKKIFAERVHLETEKKCHFPQPAWAVGHM
jgi:hypothetical protein